MRSACVLLLHSLKRVRALVLVMGCLLSGFQVLLILVAGTIQESNAFEQIAALIPEFLRQLMGPSFIGLMTFSGVVCIGYFHLAVMGALIGLAIALASEPAAEIETRFMDMILARPLARYWVITRSLVTLVLCTTFVLGMMMLGTWLGLRYLAPEGAVRPAPRLVGLMAGNLGMLVLCWGGIGLAVSAASRRRSVAGSVVGFLALGTFLLDYVARAWAPAQTVAWLSPFRYYSPLDLVMGGAIPARHLAVLGSLALAGCAASYLLFSRRDI